VLSLRKAVALVAAAVPLAFGASSALANDGFAPTIIPGSPLTVYIGDQGQMQALVAGDTKNIFYPYFDNVGNAGFFLAFPSTTTPAPPAGVADQVVGFTNGATGPSVDLEYQPRSVGPVTGNGSAAAPYAQVTTYGVNPTPSFDTPPAESTDIALVTQTTTYVNGNLTFDTVWTVKNLSTTTALPFKALTAADFFFEGSDRGTGIFTQGPPRFIGGTNVDTGRSGGFIEALTGTAASPWSAYEALQYGYTDTDVWGKVANAALVPGATFNNHVLADDVDNAGGVEWDQPLTSPALAPGQSRSFEVVTRTALPAALAFDKTNAGAPQGVPITFTVNAKDTAGTPFTGKTLRWSIGGANIVPAGSTVLDANGNGQITDAGVVAGPDTIIAYLDLNNNSTRDPNEPQGTALATFVDHTPPACTVKISGDRPVSGGGQGKPLVITVNCNSPATVTTASTLTITPAAHTAAHATAAKAKRKHKKVKKIVVKLPVTTASISTAGMATPVAIKIPVKVSKKYPGATVVATVTVTATDQAGNSASVKTVKRVKIAKKKVKRHHRR
jgi:hypothetical protein